MHTQTTLIRFIKDECANYDAHYGICLLNDKPCMVLAGTRCGYFERCVLGPPDYPYRLPGYDYAKLFAQYAEQTKANIGKVKQRKCDCGEPLRMRERYCRKCREHKRRESYRNSKKQKRLGVHS
jgi:hypothetical protein